MPSLTDLDGGEPKMTTDIRSVDHGLLTGWMGLPADAGADNLPAVKLFRTRPSPADFSPESVAHPSARRQ